jgi:hypothetical protein
VRLRRGAHRNKVKKIEKKEKAVSRNLILNLIVNVTEKKKKSVEDRACWKGLFCCSML